MKKNKYLLLIIIFLTLLAGCKSQKDIVVYKNNVYVKNINDSTEFIGDAFIYSLPRSVVTIGVEIIKTVSLPGPFFQYANRFLGIEEVTLDDDVSYKISDIKIDSYSVPDPDHFYRVETEGNSVASFLSLDEKGLIMSVNKLTDQSRDSAETNVFLDYLTRDRPDYSDLTLEENIGTQKDTIYKTVKTDTSFIRVPILKDQIGTKNIQSKAEDAAQFILKLRKRRFYVMTGKYANIPEGLSMQVVINELDKLEKDYLSLFIGRTYVEKEHYSFEYIPPAGVSTDRKVLFRFSEDKGKLSFDATVGDPVSINIRSTGNLRNLDGYMGRIQRDNSSTGSGLVYRLPDMTELDIMLSDNVIAKKKIIIPQFGRTLVMPVEVLRDSLLTIEFYPETGGIKSIRKK